MFGHLWNNVGYLCVVASHYGWYD